MEGGESLSPNIADEEENKYYVNKIQGRASYIRQLNDKARELQLQYDKTNLVNREYNRAKLQNYVDTQSRHISELSQKIRDGTNKVDMNVYIHPDAGNNIGNTASSIGVGSRENTIKTITNLINQSGVSDKTKRDLINKVNTYKRQMDNNLISPLEYKNRVNKALESCPEYDLTGLVKKDIVSDVCYGCSM